LSKGVEPDIAGLTGLEPIYDPATEARGFKIDPIFWPGAVNAVPTKPVTAFTVLFANENQSDIAELMVPPTLSMASFKPFTAFLNQPIFLPYNFCHPQTTTSIFPPLVANNVTLDMPNPFTALFP
jgi:hypothetical protein